MMVFILLFYLLKIIKMKYLISCVSAFLLIILQSCSVKSETTYYKDSATSMQTSVLMDKSMMGMMSMMDDKSSKKMDEFKNLSTEWKSLYDIQKNEKIKINEDSAKALKKVYIKLDKEKDQILGFSMKYDKLLPKEIKQIFSSDKTLKRIPLQDFAKWDGKSLTINTDDLNSAEMLKVFDQMDDQADSSTPKSKSDSVEAYGKQMAEGMIGMLKMFNLTFSNRLKFQKPIKSISGKHDYVKQIDKNTIEITLNSNDLLDSKKPLTNSDKKVVITTE